MNGSSWPHTYVGLGFFKSSKKVVCLFVPVRNLSISCKRIGQSERCIDVLTCINVYECPSAAASVESTTNLENGKYSVSSLIKLKCTARLFFQQSHTLYLVVKTVEHYYWNQQTLGGGGNSHR